MRASFYPKLLFLAAMAFITVAVQAAPLTLKEYRHRVDQQLTIISGDIDSLSVKGAGLQGDARARLDGDIQSLRDQLDRARTQWKTLLKSGSRNWLKTKKSLDAKIVQLKKSYTHAVNSLRQQPRNTTGLP